MPLKKRHKPLLFCKLVEVAGIEPASESFPQQASTCLVHVLDLTVSNSREPDFATAIPLRSRYGNTERLTEPAC